MARRWSEEDRQTLEEMYLDWQPTEKIATRLNRTKRSIECQLNERGIKRGWGNYRTHYWCYDHGWIPQERVKDYRCPIGGRQVRTNGRSGHARKNV